MNHDAPLYYNECPKCRRWSLINRMNAKHLCPNEKYSYLASLDIEDFDDPPSTQKGPYLEQEGLDLLTIYPGNLDHYGRIMFFCQKCGCRVWMSPEGIKKLGHLYNCPQCGLVITQNFYQLLQGKKRCGKLGDT